MKLAALDALLARPATLDKASYYRMVDARYAAEIDEIAHTVLYSWRYNPRGEFGVLDLSRSPECCWREKLRQVGGRAADLPPQSVGRFEARLSRCLNLNDAGVQAALSVAPAELASPSDFALTQELARQARAKGFEAILGPSAVGPDCHSLVVFKDKLAPPSYCVLAAGAVKAYP